MTSMELTNIFQLAIDGNQDAKEQILEYYDKQIQKIVEYHIQKFNLSNSFYEDLMQTGRVSILDLLQSCKLNDKPVKYFTSCVFYRILKDIKQTILSNRDVHITDFVNKQLSDEELVKLFEETESIPLDGQCGICTLPDTYDYVGTLDILKSLKGSNICSDREYDILYYRYVKQYSYRTIGQILNLSHDRIRHIEFRALNRINNFLKSSKKIIIEKNKMVNNLNEDKIIIDSNKCMDNKCLDLSEVILNGIRSFCIIPFLENKKYEGLFLATSPYRTTNKKLILGYWQKNSKYEVYIKKDTKTIIGQYTDERDAINKILEILYTDKEK